MYARTKVALWVPLAILMLAAGCALSQMAHADGRQRLVYDQVATPEQRTLFPVVLSPIREALHRQLGEPFRAYHVCARRSALVYCRDERPLPGYWRPDSLGKAFVIHKDAHLRAVAIRQ